MTVSTEDTTFEGMEAEEKNKQQHKTFDANMHKSTISSQLFGKKLIFNGSFTNGYSKLVQIFSRSMVII